MEIYKCLHKTSLGVFWQESRNNILFIELGSLYSCVTLAAEQCGSISAAATSAAAYTQSFPHARESGKILLVESGILGFGLWSSRNPKSYFGLESIIQVTLTTTGIQPQKRQSF